MQARDHIRRISIPLIVITIFLLWTLSGCGNCKIVERVEERYVDEEEEYYEIETYFIDEPYYEEDVVVTEKKVKKPQEVHLQACGDILRVNNPSDKEITIQFTADALGLFKVYAIDPMQKDPSAEWSNVIPVMYLEEFTPWLTPGTEFDLDAQGHVDLQYRGLLNDESIQCRDVEGIPCENYDDCNKNLGNNIFDLETTKAQYIKIKNARTTTVTVYEEKTEMVKKYRKIEKNRTVIVTRPVSTKRNVTVRTKICE